MAVHPASLFATAVLLGASLLTAQQPATAAAPAAAPEKTAEQVYKNIQVFQGLPASELRSTMQFFADSLGVQCTFCHAFPFDADVKPQKATARRMVKMVFAINKDTFNGRPQVTCYTCHRGSSRPDSALSVAAVLTAPPPPPAFPAPGAAPAAQGPGGRRGRGNAPAAQQILDKYTQALGGASALAAVHSELVTASRVNATGSADETITRSGDKFIISDGAAGKSGFDGSQFFNWNPRFGSRPAEGEAATLLQAEAGLYPAAHVDVSKARVFGPVPMDTHSVYIMFVPGEGGVNSRYSFDATSGLLLRIDTGTPTFIGPLPLQIDFSDYRAAGGGVTLPYDITFASHSQKWERKIASIQINADVPADNFTLPAGTERRGGAGGAGRGAPGRGPTPPAR
jgi:hypothetical protein